MAPTVGNSTQIITTNFEDFVFNITEIIGPTDEIELRIEAKTNRSNKYIGIEGLSLISSSGYKIVSAGYREI